MELWKDKKNYVVEINRDEYGDPTDEKNWDWRLSLGYSDGGEDIKCIYYSDYYSYSDGQRDDEKEEEAREWVMENIVPNFLVECSENDYEVPIFENKLSDILIYLRDCGFKKIVVNHPPRTEIIEYP